MARRLTNSTSIKLNGCDLPINTSEGKHRCYEEILERTYTQVEAMLSYHSRVLIFRLDLSCEIYTSDNKLVSKLIRKLRKHLLTQYNMKRFGYMWVRELEKAKAQHYHLVLMIDANKVRHPSKILQWLEARWQPYGRPWTPKNCFYLVGRDDHTKLAEAFERISYLAKERGKGYVPKGTNNYSTSRIALKD